MAARERAASIIDRLIETTVVFSFTRIGYSVRRRLFDWSSLDDLDGTGLTAVVTGATSGIGRETAGRLARCGAHVVLVGRDADRTERARSELADETGSDELSVVIADLSVLDSVRQGAVELASRHDRIDVLVHNAGALLADRTETTDGIETTVAAQVVGPFLMTSLLLDRLDAAPDGRVITVASGGMYTAPLAVEHLEMDEESYKGSEQYARAKRAQVTLNELWPSRAGTDVRFEAMHPGWVDTPGVAAALPMFRRVVGPLLRPAAQGADTIVWLALTGAAELGETGQFWLDRAVRPIHRLARTRRTDTGEQRDRLWSWVAARAGVS